MVGTMLLVITASPLGPKARSGGQLYSAPTHSQSGRGTAILPSASRSWMNTPSRPRDQARLRDGSTRYRGSAGGFRAASLAAFAAWGGPAPMSHPTIEPMEMARERTLAATAF